MTSTRAKTTKRCERKCRVSGRILRYFLLRAPDSLNEQEQAVLQQIQEARADLASGYGLFQEFLGMLRERQATELDGWLEKARTSGLPDLENFAEGVARDKAAVAGGLSGCWDNGQFEGQVNRRKLLKRAMFGRANFDLLRRRVLQTS